MEQKWLISGLIFLLSVLFCILPRLGRRIKTVNRVMPYATLLSAGLLLAVLVLDFIPHMISGDDGSGDHEKSEFNTQIGLFVSGISFLLLLGIDSCVLEHDHCETEQNAKKECDGHSHKKKAGGLSEVDKEGEKMTEAQKIDLSVVRNHNHTKHTSELEEGGCCNTDMIKNTNSKAKAFIFIIGISIHSFFEGLAFKSSTSFSGYEISIILHKVLESFFFGLAFLDTMFSLTVILGFTAFYSFLTPLGMILGHYFSDKKPYIGDISVFMICQGLALGSLMFIVFIEMISTAFHKTGSNTIKLTVLSLGYLLASILIMSTPHAHDHGHSAHGHSHGHSCSH